MNETADIFDRIGILFKENPTYPGYFFIFVGILMLLAAVFNAGILFNNARSFNIQKVEGWVNMFGRNTARLMVGLMGTCIILIGIVWVMLNV